MVDNDLLYLLEVLVIVDILSLVRVLQRMGLDVLPQGVDDDRACLGVDTQQSGKARVELVLRWLIQQMEKCKKETVK